MKPRRDLIHPADALMRSMERIYQYRMTTTSGGNLSIRDDRGDIWVTPSRVDKGALAVDDMVCVKSDGIAQGKHPASSELPFHRQIYAARPDVRAVIHAHPVALVAFSICGEVPDTRLLAKAWQICGEVGFVPYALPGSELLGRQVAAAFARGHNCALLENHGIVVAGGDLDEAFARFETLEYTAKILLTAARLGETTFLSAEEIEAALDRRPACSEVFDPGAASIAERALRRELSRFLQRGYRQRLCISTEGSFSARLGHDEFITTARNMDRAHPRIDDFVTVRGEARESSGQPSRAADLHREIYRAHPEVGAIINATPVHATAFAVTDHALDSRTIPESYLFLRDVERLSFRDVYFDAPHVASRISMTNPVALVENDGALVVGRSVLDAFDRLEVLESTAQALIRARDLGPIRPMRSDIIDELVRAFS